MTSARHFRSAPSRRPLAVLSALLLVLGLGAAASLQASPATADHQPGAPGPTHAGNTWGWYQFGVTRYEFIGHRARYWKVRGPGIVRNQHGMLTLNTASKGTVSATLGRKGHAYGRWEIRLRARRYGTAHKDYRVMTELVPAIGRRQHCGGRDIALENFRLGSNRVKHYIHTLPDQTFRKHTGRNLGNDRWHTFAVEVTPRRISWFVDAHVVSSETRKDALAPVPRTVRFTMEAVQNGKGRSKRMNRSRMQMDWLRYWSLRAPNERSTKAPKTEPGIFRGAC